MLGYCPPFVILIVKLTKLVCNACVTMRSKAIQKCNNITIKLSVEMDFHAAHTHTHMRTSFFGGTHITRMCANLTKFNRTPTRTFCMQNFFSYLFLAIYNI